MKTVTLPLEEYEKLALCKQAFDANEFLIEAHTYGYAGKIKKLKAVKIDQAMTELLDQIKALQLELIAERDKKWWQKL